jgi:hypothetical protein
MCPRSPYKWEFTPRFRYPVMGAEGFISGVNLWEFTLQHGFFYPLVLWMLIMSLSRNAFWDMVTKPTLGMKANFILPLLHCYYDLVSFHVYYPQFDVPVPELERFVALMRKAIELRSRQLEEARKEMPPSSRNSPPNVHSVCPCIQGWIP